MSNTKIVIDKELFDRLLKSELNDDSSKDLIDFVECLRSISDEIQIDQSIEERVNSLYPDKSTAGWKDCYNPPKKESYIEGAAQQQIIEQLKVKELRK